MNELERFLLAPAADPHAILGVHPVPRGRRGVVVRAFDPAAESMTIIERPAAGARAGSAPRRHVMRAVPRPNSGLFEATIRDRSAPLAYQIEVRTRDGVEVREDPYRFLPTLGELDLYLLGEGSHRELYRRLGAHPRVVDEVEGMSFAVWAPSARAVSLVGEFNNWDDRRHPMRALGASGVWELFMPGMAPGRLYKYRMLAAGGFVIDKTDPFAFAMETRPRTASVTCDLSTYVWNDAAWMERRRGGDSWAAPMSTYEVHLGSWRRAAAEGNRWLTYGELAEQLVPYVKEMGYTHVQLLPPLEHPFDGSWGYQVTGYFAPTSRHGSPDDFRALVDRFHREEISVLIDWVPAHFPGDAHALAAFDGTALYEHSDPRQGRHPDWGTLIFNYGRNEVRNFLMASALFWLDQYHIDGLRVDAVSSMLYLDYSRAHGEWVPNAFGGRENLEAISFLKKLNELVYETHTGAITVAEESTSWPGVSRPTWSGGLGFGFKWNMGWMHDILEYFGKDPIHRRHHHKNLTFAMLYAFSENFILALSHDEVVHGKGSLLGRMPGDDWQRFANLRALYGYQFAQPGKKLLFMGGELAQIREWHHDRELDWFLLDDARHRGVHRLVRDLNHMYRAEPALWQLDHDSGGFEWIDFSDVESSIVSFLRRGKDAADHVVCVFNLTPIPHAGYRVGVPELRSYQEILNTDAQQYGGSNLGNHRTVSASREPANGKPFSIGLILPPLSALFLKPV